MRYMRHKHFLSCLRHGHRIIEVYRLLGAEKLLDIPDPRMDELPPDLQVDRAERGPAAVETEHLLVPLLLLLLLHVCFYQLCPHSGGAGKHQRTEGAVAQMQVVHRSVDLVPSLEDGGVVTAHGHRLAVLLR